MHSAFGVEHGEVSKARVPRPPTGALTGPQKIKGKLNRMGEADVSLKGIGRGAGQSLKGVGGFLEKRPGLTGTALVGGGGAAGYNYLSQKKPKKR